MTKKDNRLTKHGLSAYNTMKRTPNHSTKSHIVVAKQNGKIKTIRFGDQKLGHAMKRQDPISKKRRKSFNARFKSLIDKNKNNKLSAMYWAKKLW